MVILEAHDFKSPCIFWAFFMQDHVCCWVFGNPGLSVRKPCGFQGLGVYRKNHTGMLELRWGTCRSQNHRKSGWKGPLEVIWPNFSARVGLSPVLYHPCLHLPDLWTLLKVEIPQPLPEYRTGSLVQCYSILHVNRLCSAGTIRISQVSIYCPLYVIAQLYLL